MAFRGGRPDKRVPRYPLLAKIFDSKIQFYLSHKIKQQLKLSIPIILNKIFLRNGLIKIGSFNYPSFSYPIIKIVRIKIVKILIRIIKIQVTKVTQLKFKKIMELFGIFSTGAWVCSLRTIRSKNPVHSVFYRIRVFLNVSGLLFRMGLEFFARIQILVYVGALAIMFRFVVMLLDISVTEIVAHQRGTYSAASLLAVLFRSRSWAFFHQNGSFENTFWPIFTGSFTLNSESNFDLFPNLVNLSYENLGQNANSLTVLAKALYEIHVDLTILASLILLVAMIGAIVLTLRQRINVPSHDVFVQHQREFADIVLCVKTKEL